MRYAPLALVLLLAACGSDPVPAGDAAVAQDAPAVDTGRVDVPARDTGADVGAVADGGLVCPAGEVDCDHDPSTGCEARIAADPANCGACGHRCEGRPLCMAGECVPWPDAGTDVGGCPSGFGDCDHDTANGCEQNLTAGRYLFMGEIVTHCGACDHQCPGMTGMIATCVRGECVYNPRP